MALMEHLGFSSIPLLGHSLGGFVALDCAIRFPERVSALILAATSAANSARNNALFQDWIRYRRSGMGLALWFRNVFYWIFAKRLFQDKDALAAALRFALDYPYPQSATAFEKQVNALRVFHCRERLSSVKQRTLVICGKADLLFPAEESVDVLQTIPRATVAMIEGAAHSIHMDNPGGFTDHVAHFLDHG